MYTKVKTCFLTFGQQVTFGILLIFRTTSKLYFHFKTNETINWGIPLNIVLMEDPSNMVNGESVALKLLYLQISTLNPFYVIPRSKVNIVPVL